MRTVSSLLSLPPLPDKSHIGPLYWSCDLPIFRWVSACVHQQSEFFVDSGKGSVVWLEVLTTPHWMIAQWSENPFEILILYLFI